MTAPYKLTVIILTYNEEVHIGRAIASIAGIATSIIVVDSGSSDRTADIARSHGAKVLRNGWSNHATQLNWGLDQLPPGSDWVLRLDADEIVTDVLRAEIDAALREAPASLSGIFLPRRIRFMGRVIRHGGISPLPIMRLFRRDKGRCEQRWMDEHIVVDGATVTLKGDLIDHNLKDIGWWTDKHNGYASREVIDILNKEFRFLPHESAGTTERKNATGAKRWLKENIYNRIPGGLRSLVYFLYRYIIRFGFIDGTQGFFFHFLQGFWYRLLVDAKLFEVRKYMRENGCTAPEAIAAVLGIDVNGSAAPASVAAV